MKIKSEEIDNNPILLKSGKDYKKYFDHIIDMNIMLDYESIKEKGDYKYALWVGIKEDEFLLKIISKPNNKTMFVVKTLEKNLEIAKYILNNFLFLFQKE